MVAKLLIISHFQCVFTTFNRFSASCHDNTGLGNTLTTSTAVGEASTSNIYLLLASDEQTMDDAGNVLCTKTVSNVPFKRNRVTILTGTLLHKRLRRRFLSSGNRMDYRLQRYFLTNFQAGDLESLPFFDCSNKKTDVNSSAIQKQESSP